MGTKETENKAAGKTDKVNTGKANLLEKFRQSAPRSASRTERLPPGQHQVTGFPVLDLGIHPEFDPAAWRLTVSGEVERPLALTWQEFIALPKITQVSDFHCVTTWSRYDLRWAGVPFRTLVEMARPHASATHLIQSCADGYTTNLPLAELTGGDVLLAYQLEGAPLAVEHGGPMRLLVPHLYAWKSAKFLTGLIFQDHDTPGYWEERGYHDRADPWEEERYR